MPGGRRVPLPLEKREVRKTKKSILGSRYTDEPHRARGENYSSVGIGADRAGREKGDRKASGRKQGCPRSREKVTEARAGLAKEVIEEGEKGKVHQASGPSKVEKRGRKGERLCSRNTAGQS